MRRGRYWLLLLGLCACRDATTMSSLEWRVRFASSDTAMRASRVEVSIVVGGCNSEQVVYTSTVTRGAEAETPPQLADGQYSLRGRAIAGNCTLIAAGCAALTVPSAGGDVELVLDDVPADTACTSSCADPCGGGTDGDASSGESSTDAGPLLEDGGAQWPDAADSCDGLKGPTGHCYRLESKTLNFADAEAACVTWGGHLVSFGDADEELWVSQQAAVLAVGGVPPNFWIGFTDAVTEAEWVWTDQSTVPSLVASFVDDTGKTKYKTASDTPYVHWGPNAQTVGNGQPNNKPPKDVVSVEGADCAASMGAKVSGPGGITPRPEWDDQMCSNQYVSVCERP